MLVLGQLAGQMDGVRSRQYYGACPPFSFLYLYVFMFGLYQLLWASWGLWLQLPMLGEARRIDLKKQNVKVHTCLASQGLG